MNVSTFKISATYSNLALPNEYRGEVITLMNADHFQYIEHKDYVDSPHTRDYGSIPVVVQSDPIFRPTYGGAPFKPGQQNVHIEVIFRNVIASDKLSLGMPDGIEFSNKFSCQSKVAAAYPHVMPVTHCAANGNTSELASFQIGNTDGSVQDWLLASEINISMEAGLRRTAELLYMVPTEWENFDFPLNIVRGGAE
eukprot:Filipodium_phascolosomae@DN2801_c1_g1_i5.p1